MKRIQLLPVIYFCIFVIGIGFLSFMNLAGHYINDEPDINEWIPESGSRFESDISNNFFAQFDFVNLNGLMARATGERELNGVLKLDNGYLTDTSPYFDDDVLNRNMNMVVAFKDYLAQRGIPLIFAVTPNTSAKYDPQIPAYYYDYGNENLDRIASVLRRGGVQVIDLRDELYTDGIDAYDMMYRTDHHWNTRMGFYAYTKICDALETQLGCEVDPVVKDIENYNIETYRKWHLGSRGQRTGKYFGGIDDFDLITPAFDTHLSTVDGEKEGQFRGLLVNTDSLQKKNLTIMRDDVAARSTYDRVLEQSLGDFVNYNSHNDKKILVAADSFGKAVLPFLEISFARVRWEHGPVYGWLIDEFEPDAVVMIYDISQEVRDHYFDYSYCVN
ncbi:MAG: hypothetical protein K5886_05790 [Lachnospiraceae bacterium]|nr:hypothetical protein [Lachnospiraceae bacterium]